MADVEKQILQQALLRSDDNRAEAAKLLRIDQSEMEAKLRQYNLLDPA